MFMIQEYLKFLEVKAGDLISWGHEFCRTAELLGSLSVFQFEKFQGHKFFVIH